MSITDNILRQLSSQGVKGKKYVKMDDNTLRVNNGWKNVDIKYNRGSDLYDIDVHETNRKTLDTKTKKFEGVYVDSLPNFFMKKRR